MIYITGDVHQSYDIRKLNTRSWPEQKNLTRNDYLIVCGDMGIVWDDSQSDRYWRNWFEDKPFTTLFVDGNHENHRLLATYPVDEWNGGKIHKIRPRAGQAVMTKNGVLKECRGGQRSCLPMRNMMKRRRTWKPTTGKLIWLSAIVRPIRCRISFLMGMSTTN